MKRKHFDNIAPQMLYIMQNGNTNQYKIGITKDLNDRYYKLQTGCPYELRIIKIWTHYDRTKIFDYETTIHRFYKHKKTRENGEWYELTNNELAELCKPNSIQEQDNLIEQFKDLI